MITKQPIKSKRIPKPADFKPKQKFWAKHKCWPNKVRCTAWNSNQGRQCGRLAMRGKTKCHKHGGKTPVGIASPNWKTGRYSKYLPQRLAGKYQEISGDTEYLNLKDSIFLADTRIATILQDMQAEISSDLWGKITKAFDDFKDATRAKDMAKASVAMSKMDAIVKQGYSDIPAWQEIGFWIEIRRKLCETQFKHIIAIEGMVPVSEMMAFLSKLSNTIKKHVRDQGSLNAIAEAMRV